jgi:hypothetical protein
MALASIGEGFGEGPDGVRCDGLLFIGSATSREGLQEILVGRAHPPWTNGGPPEDW